mmetsp:Transcript_56329/g.111945  ORF Transcript_56329/g.111945 Transcript_56329/m.111945 type:complete len:210 (+) Transcript_56329:60-689(+)
MAAGAVKGGKGAKVAKGSPQVQKPWIKQERYGQNKGGWGYGKDRWGYGKDRWGYGKDSWNYGKGDWVYKGYYDFKGYGGKGKGRKGSRAPSLDSDFWTIKVDAENRGELGPETYKGVIQNYNWQFGWGFIMPDNPEELPQQAKDRLRESMEAAVAEGKEWTDENLLYFRKPDVNHTEGFKLGKDVACTFCVYVDDKGAGAYDVSMPAGK